MNPYSVMVAIEFSNRRKRHIVDIWSDLLKILDVCFLEVLNTYLLFRELYYEIIHNGNTRVKQSCIRPHSFEIPFIRETTRRDLGYSLQVVGPADRGLWLRRCFGHGLRVGRAGSGAHRFRLPVHDVCAVVPGHVPHLALRDRGAEGALYPEVGDRRAGGLLRAHGAECGFRPCRNANLCDREGRSLGPPRVQDVDHEFAHRRRVRRLGGLQGRREGTRLSGI